MRSKPVLGFILAVVIMGAVPRCRHKRAARR